jgi:hypothetical protein
VPPDYSHSKQRPYLCRRGVWSPFRVANGVLKSNIPNTEQLQDNVCRLGDRELAIEFAKQDSPRVLPVPVRQYINGLIKSRRQSEAQTPIERIDLWKCPNSKTCATASRSENLTCWHTATGSECLRVETRSELHLFSYGYFCHAKFSRDGNMDTIEIHFQETLFNQGKRIGTALRRISETRCRTDKNQARQIRGTDYGMFCF